VTPTKLSALEKLRAHVTHLALLMYWSSGADSIPVSEKLAAEDVKIAGDDDLISPRKAHAEGTGRGGGASSGGAPPPSFLPRGGPARGGTVDAACSGVSDSGISRDSAICVPGSPRILSRRALGALNL